MNRKHTRTYEMLLRIRDFGKEHGHLFSEAGLGKEALASINRTIDELMTTDLAKRSASALRRAAAQLTARRALIDLLVKVVQLARVLRARGKPVPAFDLPVSRSNVDILTAARQFARDAAAFEADFRGHGIGAKALGAAIAAFEGATRERSMSQAGHTAANTRIRDLLNQGLLDAKRLDLIVDTELATDNVARAVWKQARRVMKGRSAGVTEVAEVEVVETAEAVPVVEATPVPAAEPSPVDDATPVALLPAATVIPMPVAPAIEVPPIPVEGR